MTITPNELPALLYHLFPNGWFYQNELRVCRFNVNWYLPLVNETERTVSPAATRQAGIMRLTWKSVIAPLKII